MDAYSDMNFRALMELRKMREEALELYDYCLAEGNVGPLEHFIEDQLAIEPPPLLLLYEISDDIQQRFLALKENHYDVRNQVIHVLQDLFKADVTGIFPADRLESYHLLDEKQVLEALIEQGIKVNDEEKTLLEQLVRRSRQTASQLQNDIQLTESVQKMVIDWVNAFTAIFAKDYGFGGYPNENLYLPH